MLKLLLEASKCRHATCNNDVSARGRSRIGMCVYTRVYVHVYMCICLRVVQLHGQNRPCLRSAHTWKRAKERHARHDPISKQGSILAFGEETMSIVAFFNSLPRICLNSNIAQITHTTYPHCGGHIMKRNSRCYLHCTIQHSA